MRLLWNDRSEQDDDDDDGDYIINVVFKINY